MKHCMRFILSFFFAISIATLASAQSNYEDFVYLKNGSIIHGTIIEQVPNESIKIQTKDKNIFVYKMDEISKMTKEEVYQRQEPRKSKRAAMGDGERKKNGYTNITELSFARSFNTTSTSYLNGSSSYYEESEFDKINNGPSIGVQTINGYQFSPYISAGIGLGINIHSRLFLLPVFVGVRGNFLPGRVTPFVAIDAGYSYTRQEIIGGSILTNDNKGGLLFSPAIGVKFYVVPKMALNLSLGFRYQEVETKEYYYGNNYGNGEYAYIANELRQFNLKFGFTF